jgi:type I restriction-modification system DNA methylase subunit
MKDAIFLIANPALLANVVAQIDRISMDDRDTKGDLYEYMLSKLTSLQEYLSLTLEYLQRSLFLLKQE